MRPLYLLLCFPTFALADGSIQGLARFAGQPVPNARITVFTPALSYFAEARTTATGAYEITDVPDGSYRLGIASRGHAYQELGVTIAGQPLTRDFALAPETAPGQWTVIGNTLPEYFDATDISILMPDGQLFFCHDTVDPILFNPITGQKTFPAGSMSEQGCMNASLLPDGRICMVGGQEGSEPGNFRLAVPWVKAYDRAANSWSMLPWLQHPTGRWYPGLARLADGSFLVMGGGTRPNATRTETCERLNLANLTWSYTGSMLQPTEFPPSALLHNGLVLMTWYPPQLYTPSTGQWRLTGNFQQPARGWPGHSDHSIVVLADGRVAAIGIARNASNYSGMAEIYDPATEEWTVASSPAVLRFQSEVTHLPDGRILVAGGDVGPNPLPGSPPNILGCVKWTDLFDPIANTWRRVADMTHFREYHAVTLLVPDGRVVTTGGTRIKFQYGPTSADIEAFSPPYLFRGVRPQITGLSSTTPGRGESVSLQIAPATQLTSVVLMGMQTHTHWVDGGIHRRLILPVQQSGSTANVQLPADPNLLPLGHYVVFAMVDDIPSIARIIQVQPGCYGNCDGSTNPPILNVADFTCFLQRYAAGDPYANCDNSTVPPVLNVSDFTCFLQRFAAGCN